MLVAHTQQKLTQVTPLLSPRSFIDIIRAVLQQSPVAPGAQLLPPAQLENLRFFIQIICWAPQILHFQSTGLPSIFLRTEPCIIDLPTDSSDTCTLPKDLRLCKEKWNSRSGQNWGILDPVNPSSHFQLLFAPSRFETEIFIMKMFQGCH